MHGKISRQRNPVLSTKQEISVGKILKVFSANIVLLYIYIYIYIYTIVYPQLNATYKEFYQVKISKVKCNVFTYQNLLPSLFSRRSPTRCGKNPGEDWSRVSQNMRDNKILSSGVWIGKTRAMPNYFVQPKTFLEHLLHATKISFIMVCPPCERRLLNFNATKYCH